MLGLAWALCMWAHALDALAYFFRETLSAIPEQSGLAIVAWGLGLAGAITAHFCFRKDWPEGSHKLLTLSEVLLG
ncbi:MAG: hypothetical protein EA353_11025 [Puniceicoccaceae bacterium]|nr:MAG: hypothetical protein EA353_11025 [Puniceicoccaceae bacterium]